MENTNWVRVSSKPQPASLISVIISLYCPNSILQPTACSEVKEQFRISKNIVSDVLVGAEDIFMTLCDLAKVEVDQRHQAVDSISFARVLIDGYQISPRH